MKKIHIITFKNRDHKSNKMKIEQNCEKRRLLGKKIRLHSELEFLPRTFFIEDADEETLQELRNNPEVASVSESQEYTPFSPQSTEWSHGTAFLDIAQFRSRGLTGAGVKVGIIDSGAANHQDLQWAGRFNAYAAVHGGNFPPEADKNGHGTKVAGIIGAKNNSLGYVGVAPDCLLYGVKVDNNVSKGGFDSAAIIRGINWLIQQGVKIINCSFGDALYDNAMETAIRDAYEIHDVLFIAAAGNSREEYTNPNKTVQHPASSPYTIAVGALKASKAPAYYSSRGPELDVVAPADPVMSTNSSANNKNGANYFDISTEYSSFSGTSCAAPHVTGLAALYKQLDSSATADDLRAAIEIYTEDLGKDGRDDEYGHGMVTSPWTTHPDYPGKRTSNAIVMSGSSISSSLTNGLVKHFKFTPSTEGRYTITTSSSLDLYMRLYDANYNQLGQNDDGAGNSQPKIVADLTAGRTYYIVVSGFSGSQTGSFTINATNAGKVIIEDFEDSTLVIPFTGSRWSRVILLGNNGSTGYRASASHGVTSETSFKATVPSGKTATLSFYYKTSTEAVYDNLIVTVNNTEILRKSGSVSGIHTHQLSAGVNTIAFKFVRDGSGDGGGNYVVIDDVTIIGDGVTVSSV